ncbi:tRNAHis guanylyltransferase [uncultured archaeon]|nr:tRNAHis guanylyltransferase [uncultured archaeon]
MGNISKKDALGNRMKSQYENRFRHFLPRRTYVLVRCDGKSFHSWTRGLEKPYSKEFMECIDAAALELCKNVSGARFAYVQSDEISLLITDFDTIDTQAWFDNCQNKIESITASIATMAFNLKVLEFNQKGTSILGKIKKPNAIFDSRAWVIPDPVEVENYFIWRQQDATRNSVNLLASAYASPKQLHGKNMAKRHEIIHAAGDNWANHPARFKHGSIIRYDSEKWMTDKNIPIFTQDRGYLGVSLNIKNIEQPLIY